MPKAVRIKAVRINKYHPFRPRVGNILKQSMGKCVPSHGGKRPMARPLYRYYCEDCQTVTDWKKSWTVRRCLKCDLEVPLDAPYQISRAEIQEVKV